MHDAEIGRFDRFKDFLLGGRLGAERCDRKEGSQAQQTQYQHVQSEYWTNAVRSRPRERMRFPELTSAQKTPSVASHSAALAARKDRRSTGSAVLPEGGSLSFMIHMQDVMAKPMPDFREGSIVKGRILEVRPREVLVDVGYKSEGVIPLTEFDDIESLEVGDEVDVLLERLENEEGMVVLSKEKAAYRQNWNKIVGVFEGDGMIKGKVKSVVKGGLMVNIGVEAFLPASQIPASCLEHLA